MKKIMFFPTLAFFLMSFFAFTPVEADISDTQADCSPALILPCPGSITVQVVVYDFQNPGNALYAITDVNTGIVVESGSADVEDLSITLPAGTYQISVSSDGAVWFFVKYDFCTGSFNGNVDANASSTNVGSQFTIL